MADVLDFDEINKLAEYSFNTSESCEKVIDDVASILIDAYVTGFEKANRDLGTNYTVEADELYDMLYLAVAGMTFEERIRDYYFADSVNKAMSGKSSKSNGIEPDSSEKGEKKNSKAGNLQAIQKVVSTESHRMVNSGINRVGELATKDGKTVYKTWSTMGDDKVREAHDYLEGMKIPFDQKFYTFDGDSALYCGGFSNAANNINCRCWIVLTS